MQKQYFIVIEKGAKGFGGFFPDVPGCVTAGDTIAQTVANGHEALQGHIDLASEYGEAVAPPTDPENFEIDDDITVACLAMVSVSLPSPVRKVTVTIPGDILDRIAAVSSNRSGFLATAARHELDRLAEG